MGGRFSTFIGENYPPKPRWSPKDIPDLTGKVIIVTGASGGIGKEVAKSLLEHNAKVYIAVRNPDKAEAAIRDLREQTGKEAIFLKLDLADLHSVKKAAEEFMSKESELHVLFNNGGVATSPMDLLTAQGYDLQFGTNVIGHFLFTKLLIPVLSSTAKSTPEGKVRVVHTSSFAHVIRSKLDFNTFKDGPARRKLARFSLYAQSKLGNMLVSNEMARRYADQGIVSIGVHPGSVRSDLARYAPSLVTKFFNLILFYPTHMGAIPLLYAGANPAGLDFNGKYVTAWDRIGTPAKIAEDPVLARQLWEYLEEQVKDI